jgi:hypothetical protein
LPAGLRPRLPAGRLVAGTPSPGTRATGLSAARVLPSAEPPRPLGRRPILPSRRRACSASHRGHLFPSLGDGRHAATSTRLLELAGDTATSPAYLCREHRTLPRQSGFLDHASSPDARQERVSCPRFSPVHHIRRTVRVGRTGAEKPGRFLRWRLPHWPRSQTPRACTGRAESATSGMVPAFLMPSPSLLNRLAPCRQTCPAGPERAGPAP